MSKSKPETCIYLHDGPKAIKRKIKKAHCPAGELENNSVLEIAKLILFKEKNFKLEVTRPEKFGGDIKFENIASVENAFSNNELHPMDLKNGVSSALAEILKEPRRKFEKQDDIMETMSKLTGVPVEFE